MFNCKTRVYISAYKLAFKEGKLELACDYLINASKLSALYAYNLSSCSDKKAAAYLEAAELAFLADDVDRAIYYISKGVDCNPSDRLLLSLRELNKNSPRAKKILSDIFLRKRIEKQRLNPNIGDIFLLSEIPCFNYKRIDDNPWHDKTMYVKFDYAIYISSYKSLADNEIKNLLYLINSKKYISEHKSFLHKYALNILELYKL